MVTDWSWSSRSYDSWAPCCDTLHAETQILGKLALALAPPEPQLLHTALRLTARGWETPPLPAPGGGFLGVSLDLREHEVVVEHSGGDTERFALEAGQSVAAVTAGILDAIAKLASPVEISPEPQEVTWTVPLDEDEEHRHYDPESVAEYFASAIRAAQVLTKLRAPFRGRVTPVNAWWGSLDLAVNFFSGLPAEPPSAQRDGLPGDRDRMVAGRFSSSAAGVLRVCAPGAERLRRR